MERARYNTEPYSNRSPPPNIMLNRPTFGGHITLNPVFSIYTKYFIVPSITGFKSFTVIEFSTPNKMSNHTLPHQNSVIQQPGIPLSHFLQQDAYLQFPRNTKSTKIHTLSHKTINYTTQNYQIQIYTKQKGTFILFIIYLIPEAKVLKSLHSPSLLRTPRSACSVLNKLTQFIQ